MDIPVAVLNFSGMGLLVFVIKVYIHISLGRNILTSTFFINSVSQGNALTHPCFNFGLRVHLLNV